MSHWVHGHLDSYVIDLPHLTLILTFIFLKFLAQLSNLCSLLKKHIMPTVKSYYGLVADDPIKCKEQVNELIMSGSYIYPRTLVRHH